MDESTQTFGSSYSAKSSPLLGLAVLADCRGDGPLSLQLIDEAIAIVESFLCPVDDILFFRFELPSMFTIVPDYRAMACRQKARVGSPRT